ncbi:Bacitracin export ATP-binding protein BceA [compost metagenome]
MTTLLSIRNIEKYYGNKKQITKAIDNISFQVASGEFIGVMGASGSGKTTLLNVISTIDQVSAGHIYLNDTDITEITERDIAKFRRQNLGFIFQDFNLLDTLTLHENIALALTINTVDPGTIDEKVHMVALQLGINEILSKFPYEVSGGQKQRCACARAIVTKPQLILADEPTGALDSKSAQMLLKSISDMNTKLGATILMVTHDAFAASYCNRILFLKDGTIFNELIKGEKSRKQFFNEILDVMALLGGDLSDVF